ncbi:MAG: hypothetical protein KGI72_05260 [Patescibacteria group bacterium]|nr:hypothetical protein [Patescibacteria group bacterium]
MITIKNADLPVALELELEWGETARRWLLSRSIGWARTNPNKYQHIDRAITEIDAIVLDELNRQNDECQICGGCGYYYCLDEEIKCVCQFVERDEDFSTASGEEK